MMTQIAEDNVLDPTGSPAAGIANKEGARHREIYSP